MRMPPWDKVTDSEFKRIFVSWQYRDQNAMFFPHLPEDRILNYPLKVHMFGWESNTRNLQHRGWSLSMKQDVRNHSIQLALNHADLKLLALSRNYDEFNFMRIARDSDFSNRFLSAFVFDIDYLASKIEVILHGGAFDSMRHPYHPYEMFSPVDAEPRWERLERRQSLEDFMLFRPINNSKNVIVDPNDVPGLMEMILKAQSPAQEEIRQRQRSRENMAYVIDAGLLPRHDIHAQIITIAA